MRVELFQSIPKQAIEIRQKVFVEEQGFQNEFDDIDYTAVHFVVFNDWDKPIATCRVFLHLVMWKMMKAVPIFG